MAVCETAEYSGICCTVTIRITVSTITMVVATSMITTAIAASALTMCRFLIAISVGMLGIVFFSDSFMTFRYDVTLEATMVAADAATSCVCLYDVGV